MNTKKRENKHKVNYNDLPVLWRVNCDYGLMVQCASLCKKFKLSSFLGDEDKIYIIIIYVTVVKILALSY